MKYIFQAIVVGANLPKCTPDGMQRTTTTMRTTGTGHLAKATEKTPSIVRSRKIALHCEPRLPVILATTPAECITASRVAPAFGTDAYCC
jgi:hypothetical protein